MKKLLVVLAFVSATAHAQYCTGYDKEYALTLSANMGAAQSNFTLLVSGTYPYLAGTGSGGFSRSPNGYDITFNELGTIPLVWNMPIYVSTTGQIKANVLIPSAAPGTVISMCVGKAGMSAPTGKAYDSFTDVALQFPSAGVTVDSTGIQTVTNPSGVTHVTTGPTFLIDAGNFNGAQALNIAGGGIGFPASNGARHVGFWMNPASASGVFVSWGTYASQNAWNVTNSGARMTVDFGMAYISATTVDIPVGSWSKWDIEMNPATSNIIYYKDGVQVGYGDAYPQFIHTTLSNAAVGSGPGWGFMTGQLADVRIANTTRSTQWIAAEFASQSNPPAFYAIVPVARAILPVISGVTITANSPLSVKATWTTDLPSNSQVLCGTVRGGPYPYASSIVNPNVNGWNVKTHSMASNPMPNGVVYCVTSSASADLFAAQSAEVGPITLPPMPVSVPITMVDPAIKVQSKLGDHFAGTNGATKTGAWSFTDNGYFCWADDNNEYYFMGGGFGLTSGLLPSFQGALDTLGVSFAKFTDATHTDGTLMGAAWQNGVNNMGFNSYHDKWLGSPCISVNGNLYVGLFNFDNKPKGMYSQGDLAKSSDHFESTLAPNHNVGPDTTYITAMTCDNTPNPGTIHATSKLNVTDELPIISPPFSMAMYVAGATGTAVNGVFGNSVSATATTISWINPGGTCAGWSWTPTGGTGSGGGTINVYGWDVPTKNVAEGMYGAWVQNDGPDYVNGTPWAGMDGNVYWFSASSPHILSKMRIEDMPLQGTIGGTVKTYNGKQLGDDGIYERNWSTGPPTQMNPAEWATRANGKGAVFPQMQYLTDLHRFVVAFEVAGAMDSASGGTAIYDAGPYPWSPLTLIGNVQRNVDIYFRPASGPEFPQFVAKSQTHANGITTINIGHDGGNFAVNVGVPALNGYDMYMNVGLQFVAKPPTTVLKPALAAGEVAAGMDLAYNFDSPTGSLSMPNASPSDASQKWAWKAPDALNPLWTDQYGSTLHSVPLTASNDYFPTTGIAHNMFTTPYAEPLPGPLTLMDCFGHYPTTLLNTPGAGAIALRKGTDLTITWAGGDNWAIHFLGTLVGNVAIPDNSIGCAVVRRDSSNRVTLFTSAGIGKSLPLTGSATATVSGTWTTSPLVTGDGGLWGNNPLGGNSFWGIESLLRIWSRGLADDELIAEMAAVRTLLWARGKGSSIPAPDGAVLATPLPAPLALNIVGATNTQALVSYTAPIDEACKVEVSESDTYLPLVHDVDPGLFPGADSDLRPSSIANGRFRIVVLGTRNVGTALDGNNYSQALQANTRHYLRTTCGSTVQTATFTTPNIPLGMTYTDIPQVDNSNPGQWVLPTIPPGRNFTIIDPHTGSLIKPLTTQLEKPGGGGAYMTYGGATRMCANQLLGPGPGYLCAFDNLGGGAGMLYYVVPSTGDSRYLGQTPNTNPRFDPTDGNIYWVAQNTIAPVFRSTYSGDYLEAAPGHTMAPFTTDTFSTGAVGSLVQAFNPAFDPTKFTCSLDVNGSYGTMKCGSNSGSQNVYGWVAVLDMGNRQPVGNCGADPMLCPHVIATNKTWATQLSRNCGLHGGGVDAWAPVMGIAFHSMDMIGDTGPYISSLTSPILAGGTMVAVSGEPVSSTTGLTVPDATVHAGDQYRFVNPDGILRDTDEKVTIAAVNSPTSWTLNRTKSIAYAAGYSLKANCNAWGSVYWKFLADPYGTDLSGSNYLIDNNWDGGHQDSGPNVRIGENYEAAFGPLMANLPLNTANVVPITSSPRFAGTRGHAWGQSYDKHPSYHQINAPARDQNWFSDFLRYIGGSNINPAMALVPGTTQTYKYIFDVDNTPNVGNRKNQPTLAISGMGNIVDVSGPGVQLGDTNADNLHYCVANSAGECHSGSIKGDAYANISGLGASPTCRSFGNPRDMCISAFPTFGGSVVQVGLYPDPVNEKNGRVLTQGLTSPRSMFDSPTAKSLPDGSWMMFGVGAVAEAPIAPSTANLAGNVMLVKNLPYTQLDAVDRTTFLPLVLTLTPPADGRIASAVIEFGYAEQGTTAQHYCTSRREACIASAASLPAPDGAGVLNDPFWFASDTYTGVACVGSCQITVPALPMHVLYYQAKYLDASNRLVALGERGVAAELAAISESIN